MCGVGPRVQVVQGWPLGPSVGLKVSWIGIEDLLPAGCSWLGVLDAPLSLFLCTCRLAVM